MGQFCEIFQMSDLPSVGNQKSGLTLIILSKKVFHGLMKAGETLQTTRTTEIISKLSTERHFFGPFGSRTFLHENRKNSKSIGLLKKSELKPFTKEPIKSEISVLISIIVCIL